MMTDVVEVADTRYRGERLIDREDVIDTLIVRHVINITDLPDQAQAKLFARKSFRERVSKSSLQLFDQPTNFGDVI